jgi:pyruvate kinase
MLSGETAGGEHPTAAVKIMAETCTEAESAVNFNQLYQAVRNSTMSRYGHLSTSESIASSAVKTAIDVSAKAIIVCSESGATAAQIAKFRPGRPVTVLTTQEQVARQCFGVLKGCTAMVLPSLDATDVIVNDVIETYKKAGIAKSGDAIVVVHGTSARVGATSIMRMQYA